MNQQAINSQQLTTNDPNAFNYQSELEQVKRRKAYADMLAQRGMPEGRMVGQVYAAPHWGAQLAAALERGLGGYEARKAAEAGEGLETRRQAEIAQMLGQYKPETTTPQEQLALAQGLEGLGAGGLANAAFSMQDRALDRRAKAAADAREEKRYQENLALRTKEVEGKLADKNQPVTKVVGNELVTVGPNGQAQVIYRATNPNQRPQGDPEKVSLIVSDRNGNRKLDSSAADILSATYSAAIQGRGALEALDKAIAVADIAPESKIGSAAAAASSWVPGMKSAAQEAAEAINSAVKTALAALKDDPRVKGAPSNRDIESIEQTISDPTASPAQKREAMNRVKRMIETVVTASNTAIGELDDESLRYLRGVGMNLQPISLGKKDEKEQPPAAPAGPASRGSTREQYIQNLMNKGFSREEAESNANEEGL